MAFAQKLLSPITNLLKSPKVPARIAPPSQQAIEQAPGILRRNLQQNQVPTIFGGQATGKRNFLGG